MTRHAAKLLALLGATATAAATPPAENGEGVIELEPVVVVATRSPRPVSEVVGQVTVVDAADIDTALAGNLDEVFRYVPGIDAERSGTRFGVSGINIRGIGGNRVRIEVDGVPVRDRFAIGSYSDAGRALVETERVRRVEVLHGPASALYGSDALGGIVAITTWAPVDLLARGDGRRFAALHSAWRGVDDGWVLTGTGALGGEDAAVMASWTRRDAHQRDDRAEGGAEDRQNSVSDDLVLRAGMPVGDTGQLTLSAEDWSRETRTDIESLLGAGRFRDTTLLEGDDRDDSERLTAAFETTAGPVDQLSLRAWHARSETHQATLEERPTARVPARLRREFSYSQRDRGLSGQAFTEADAWGAAHRIGAGFEWIDSRFRERRDGRSINLLDGSVSTSILGEQFPLRDFPVSDVEEFGLFVQDELRVGAFEWIAALRWDRYALDPREDALYRQAAPLAAAVSVDDSELTPRAGVLWSVDAHWSVYAQYVEGFRAPPVEDANIGLDIPLFNIRALPNPNLQSERSSGWETGLRGRWGATSLTLAGFDTRYEEFIESKALVGVDPETGTLLFQSRNIDSARIRGIDLGWRHAWRTGPGSRLSLDAAAFWAEAENRQTGQPLNSLAPAEAVVRLGWASSDGRWDATVAGSFVQAQDEVDESGGPLFRTPGYGTVDLLVGWRPRPGLELRAGLFNLGDKRYWRWNDVAGLPPGDPVLDVLTRPGRNLSVSLHLAFGSRAGRGPNGP